MRQALGAVRESPVPRLTWRVLAGAAVAAAVYLIGSHHSPSYDSGLFGQHGIDAVRLKTQLATGILALALVQVVLALGLYGKLPGLTRASRPVGRLHRATGFALFLVSVPVAVHCVLTYGVQTYNTRVAVHSLAGCFFYGAFVVKVLVVRSRRLPGWLLPAAGGLLVTVIAVLWYSSALWYLNGFRLPLT